MVLADLLDLVGLVGLIGLLGLARLHRETLLRNLLNVKKPASYDEKNYARLMRNTISD